VPPDSALVTREPSPWQPRLDPLLAARLLAEAGFPGGKNFPRFELTAWSPSQVAVLEALQAMWREHLGIEVTIAIREAKIHLSALAAGTYDLAFVTTLVDVADATAVLSEFTTGAPGNYPHWSDATYDERLVRLAATREPGARAALQTEADEHLLREAVVAPLYLNTRTWLMSPRVHGWSEDAFWNRHYHGVRMDAK
jgi:oligopeptide transport system substrate-binding protein